MKRIYALAFLMTTLFFAAELRGAQRTFVSAASGDDTNPCTRPLPCRNFAAALPGTDPDGEVVVLDSGGYGVVTIAQPVSLVSPRGVHAGVTAFSLGTGITVNAGDPAHVVLRNLSISSLGALYGIDVNTAASVVVDGCTVSGFNIDGILFDPTTAAARLAVTDTVVRRSGTVGIDIIGGTASIDSTRVQKGNFGIYVNNATATIRRSMVSGNGGPGFSSAGTSKVAVEESVATNTGYGFYAYDGAVMVVTRSTAAANTYGAGSAGTLYMSDSTLVGNGIGVARFSTGTMYSRLNNTIEQNTTSGTFTGPFFSD